MLEFDNVIVSPWMEERLKEYRAAALAPDPSAGLIGLIAGVGVTVNRFVPEKNILLMKGQNLVGILLYVPENTSYEARRVGLSDRKDS